jgi:YD repeat-containing protein
MTPFTRYFLTPLLVILFALTACQKDKYNPFPIPDPKNDLPRHLLKSIAWDNGMQSLMHYNTDSTVSHITFALGSAAGQIIYTWNEGRLVEVYDDRSLYTNQYVYDDKGRLTAIRNTNRQGQLNVSYTLEYTYDANNRLQILRYYRVNEAGKQLQETTTYHYNAGGSLVKMETQSGNSIITRRVEAWSDRVQFAYAHFISASLNEHYSLYNYPLLSQLDRLPAKVTKLIKTGTAPEQVEQVAEIVYSISNHRIDKTVTNLTYPNHPNLNQTQDAVYTYY